ncbi:hypothetical protein CHS0354_032277 [Potamilus streckersoni]|uniref:Myb/SANT-like DNA-binding domain-containing protein n=1 Tax=Potamilus streckersoni TaxID=2493646 RepID=A0AAE0RPW4_9BIVA|nr:hypothetical protein CHS0354_032277 [Potamilus streckersoni]
MFLLVVAYEQIMGWKTQRKRVIWHSIANGLNARNPYLVRSANEVRRKWKNLVTISRRELHETELAASNGVERPLPTVAKRVLHIYGEYQEWEPSLAKGGNEESDLYQVVQKFHEPSMEIKMEVINNEDSALQVLEAQESSMLSSSVTNEDTSTSGATPSPQSPLQTAIASSMSHLSQYNNKKNCNTDLVVPVILNQRQDLQSHAFPTQTVPAMNLHVRNVQPNPIRTVSAVSIQTSPQPREGCTMNRDEGSQQARAFPLLLNSESDNLNYLQEDILFLKKRKLFLETEILEMQKKKLSLEIQSLEMDIRKKSTNKTN